MSVLESIRNRWFRRIAPLVVVAVCLNVAIPLGFALKAPALPVPSAIADDGVVAICTVNGIIYVSVDPAGGGDRPKDKKHAKKPVCLACFVQGAAGPALLYDGVSTGPFRARAVETFRFPLTGGCYVRRGHHQTYQSRAPPRLL